jgi:hypothetical protein
MAVTGSEIARQEDARPVVRLVDMGIDPHNRYVLGRARQVEMVARSQQAQAIRDVKARHDQLAQDDVVSAPVQQRRRRLASLFSRPITT